MKQTKKLSVNGRIKQATKYHHNLMMHEKLRDLEDNLINKVKYDFLNISY